MKWSLEDLDIESILKDIISNIWVILLAVATIFFGITGLYSLHYEPEYTSTATIAVTMRGNNNDYSSLPMTKEMAGIFCEAFQSETLYNKIKEDLGTDSVVGKINIEVVEETNLMNLSAVSNTSLGAYQMMQSALKNYDSVSDYLFSNAMIHVLKEPSVPNKPSNLFELNHIRKKAMILAVGIVILLIVVLSFLRPTIKNEKNAKKQLEGHCLGIIPYVEKYRTKKEWLRKLLHMDVKNTAVLISSVMVGLPFINSVKKIATSLKHHLNRHGGNVLVVTSVEENEGKSSVVSNLALALAESGNRVLLIDTDLKKPALYRIFDQEKIDGKSVSDILEGNQTLSEILTEVHHNVFVAYQYESIHNSSGYVSDTKMKALIEEGKKQFDYVLLDTPPVSLSADAEIILAYADSAVLVVRQDWAEIGEVNDTIDVIRQSNCTFAGYICNAFRTIFPWKNTAVKDGYSYGMMKYTDNVTKQR